MTAKFSDCFDKSGEYRVLYQNQIWYVAGHGMLIPVKSYPDGTARVKKLNRFRAEEFGQRS
jgi:hypothetical protein